MFDTVKWNDTGKVGEHGRIYKNPITGELAEEYEGAYLVELPKPLLHGGSCFLLERERAIDSRGRPI